MFTFSNEYLLKSMWASVRDEGDRIVSLGLTTHNNLKDLIDPAMIDAIKQATNGIRDDSIMLRTLSNLYDKLRSVSLPGDFEKIAENEDEKIHNMLDVIVPEKISDTKEIEKVDESIDDEIDTQDIEIVYATLKDIAYKLGHDGNHNEAYLVERTIRNIENLVVQGKTKV